MSAEGSWAAIILSGGASERMGRPKALLDWEGATVLGRTIELYAACADCVVVVLGHGAEAIAAAVPQLESAIVVLNPRPERGQASSLACGLKAVPESAGWIWFTPVDAPGLHRSTLAVLRQAAETADSQTTLVLPEFEGRRGHPAAFRRAILPDFLNLTPHESARDVLNRRRMETLRVPVADEAVRRDLDFPEHYAAAIRRSAP